MVVFQDGMALGRAEVCYDKPILRFFSEDVHLEREDPAAPPHGIEAERLAS